jgi:hypothetical protein
LTIERLFEMPRKWTFQMPKLRAWVESRLEGDVLNLFGGVTQLTPPAGGVIVTNDLHPDIPSTHKFDACDLTQWVGLAKEFDTVIFDPPYSDFQAVKTYGVKKAQKVTHARDVVEWVIRPGGRVISLGFNSTGMGLNRGYEKEGLLLVNCGGSHNDYIVLSERHTGKVEGPQS